MKQLLAVCITMILVSSQILSQKVEQIWASEPVFKVPESVLFSEVEKVLYVSNIDGVSGEKDGKGHISKLAADGKVIELEWVKGLHAPKGMAQVGKNLYVADLDALVVINCETGKITSRIEIPGAKFLNDLTADNKGVLYVSDSETGIIHEINDSKPKPIITGRTRPNGVLWFDGKLYFADAGALFVRQQDGSILEIAKGMERSTDGIEPINKELFLMSSWVGALYLVNINGQVTELLNTKAQQINSADIGYDSKNRILYVPTFNNNRVVAYKLIL